MKIGHQQMLVFGVEEDEDWWLGTSRGPGGLRDVWTMDCMVQPCGCDTMGRLERSRGLRFKFVRVRLARKELESLKFFFCYF
jgi:hypothetical protein